MADYPSGTMIDLPKSMELQSVGMKLWILRRVLPEGDKGNHWDETFGMVVRAETEQRAREIADTRCKFGTDLYFATTCEPLVNEGDEGILIEDFHAG